MKKFLLIIVIFSLNINAQNDPRAEKLLAKVSNKIDSAKSYKIDFKYTLENKLEGINQDADGTVTIQGDNYLLNFMGITQICDSNNIYSIVPENEEVIISSIEEEEEQTIKPSKLLNFYREGYLILWDKLQSDYDNKIQFVKLIPSNSNSDIDYLLLGINISNNNISKLIEIGKNKTKTILNVNSIVFDPVLEKDIFIFNENNYIDYYIEKL
ncbi:MAG: outer membrane lipoprotein carrier protein LolA [Flavobacteriaceae bacterium]|nr:outer membrane lipoprotein carrier protein LolA [Flavobacteriaceae bacterium]MDC3221041.1 outer membrane lipoprotein carrier protein LolA [Flavobacteriaceae bacterium]MDG1343743.1 outer membrane lipoprotein carrier protein LolA [Flavobacteriaceae bacterium]MDG1791830.1 outer membrane lipoprotein carrier protein LolA [Flavobacteriaceae bacterium]|tara:strand:- start:1247 stop:1882 length:636 start_codon:yes stop_codon:yes gene_type:complete